VEAARQAGVKKLVIDARESGTSTGRYIDKLVEYLAKLKPAFEVTVFAKSPRVDYIKTIAPDFEVLPADYKEFTFAEQLGFKKYLKQLQPDLVHFPAAQQPIWYRGKVITTIQDLTTVHFTNPNKNLLVFKSKQLVYKYVVRRVARKSAALLAISQYVKDDIVDYASVDPAKVIVTLEAADPFEEPPELIKTFENKKFIMFNGRPLPHKNLERLIEAFARLRDQHPDLYLMIAGKKDRSHDSYEALAKKLKVEDRVVLTDWVTDGQLRWAMEHAEAYVYPSLSEGFGLPPLEAMLNGAPVVASNATSIPEVCGEAAHYFNPLDTQNMAGAINEVLTNKDLRNELIKQGSQQVKKYSWQRMAEQTLAVYEKVLREA
jgi:glycosyltransferase involved in cell wall biosynthesis